MSNYFYAGHQQQQQQHHVQNPHPLAINHNHHGRSRRALRMSASQTGNRQFRQQKSTRESVPAEAPSMTAFRARFEAGRSFDLDDDLEFCPNLLSFHERQSVNSGLSDRSSLSSSSPESSPLQHQIQPQVTPALSITSAATSSFMPPPTSFNHNQNMKIYQPSALRSRNNAIPIVNPSTGNRIASPPSSISPSMMQQTPAVRRW